MKATDENDENVVYFHSETDESVLALVEAAVGLLNQAEVLNGQPLFYDEEGGSINIDTTFAPTIHGLRKNIEAGHPKKPLIPNRKPAVIGRPEREWDNEDFG